MGTRKVKYSLVKIERRGEMVLKVLGNSPQKTQCMSGAHQRMNSLG